MTTRPKPHDKNFYYELSPNSPDIIRTPIKKVRKKHIRIGVNTTARISLAKTRRKYGIGKSKRRNSRKKNRHN